MWKKAQVQDLPELIKQLSRREWENMHFSSRIFNKGKPRLPGWKGSVYLLKDFRHNIKAALMFWERCQLFPLFPEEGLSLPELQAIMPLCTKEAPQLFSLIGRADTVEQLLKILPCGAEDRIEYRLLTLNGPFSKPGGVPGLRFKTAGPGDINRLFPLEADYQREEVLRHPEYLNEPYARRLFLRQLKEQLVVYALKGKTPVAKAATNARGFLYNQLGGIFTSPEHRNRGIGLKTLEYLLYKTEKDQRHACLFVKTDNASARALYRNCGFQDRGRFMIAYFE